MARKYTKINIERLKDYIDRGNNIEQLCFKLNVSKSGLYAAADREGVKLPYEPKYVKMGKWDNETAVITHMSDEPAKELAISIIERAAKDYKLLLSIKKEKGEEELRKASTTIGTISEINNFFRSEWFEFLTTVAGVEISGEQVIKELNKNA